MVEADSFKPTRIRARDAYTNSIQGISAAKAKDMMEKRKKVTEDECIATYTTQKEKRQGIKNDFYLFQKKLALKSSLDELKAGFEKDKKRLEKAMRKEKKL